MSIMADIINVVAGVHNVLADVVSIVADVLSVIANIVSVLEKCDKERTMRRSLRLRRVDPSSVSSVSYF